MISTKELDPNLLEAEFYKKPFFFSYSSFNKLLTAPAVFYKEYIMKEREETYAKHLLEGIIIHYLVLENQGFDEKFIISSEDLPSPNNQLVADTCFRAYLEQNDDTLELKDFEELILETLKDINLYQSLKDTKDGTGDSKRIGKIVEAKTIAYFNFLKKKKNRTIIDSALLDKCTRRADVVKKNAEMRELLGLDIVPDGRIFGVYNELHIRIDPEEERMFGYQGTIDNLVVDARKKLIRINDFKTTGKSLTDFSDSVEFWNYWLQAAMYIKLVRNFFSEVLTDEWAIEFRFIVFDKYDQLYAFPVRPETMSSWEEKLKEVELQGTYHIESKDFSLPYNYAQGNVEL